MASKPKPKPLQQPAGKGSPGIKVSKNVTVKPQGNMTAKEVARLRAINAPKADPNKSRSKSATKAANKDVVSKPMPKASKLFGKKVVGQPKQVSKAKAAKIALRGGGMGGGGLINRNTR